MQGVFLVITPKAYGKIKLHCKEDWWAVDYKIMVRNDRIWSIFKRKR